MTVTRERSTLDPLHRRRKALIDAEDTILSTAGNILGGQVAAGQHDLLPPQSLMVDGFGYPILYYRANPNGQLMTSAAGRAGIFSQADNVLLTGDGRADHPGVDLGGGIDHALDQYSPQTMSPTLRTDNLLRLGRERACMFHRLYQGVTSQGPIRTNICETHV